MKQKIGMVLALAMLVCALVLTGCGADPHAGNWVADEVVIGGETLPAAQGLGAEMTLILQDGDAMALVITDETDSEAPATERGHWKVNSSTLTLTFDVCEENSQLADVIMEGTFKGRTLTIENWLGTGMTLKFAKAPAV